MHSGMLVWKVLSRPFLPLIVAIADHDDGYL